MMNPLPPSEDDDISKAICYNTQGQIVAMKGLVVPYPWQVVLSKKYTGEYKEGGGQKI